MAPGRPGRHPPYALRRWILLHFVVLGLTQQGDRLVLSEVSAPWAQDRATVAAALRAALAVMEAPQEAPAVPATILDRNRRPRERKRM